MSVPGQPIHFRDLSRVSDAGVSSYVVHSDLHGAGLEETVIAGEGAAVIAGESHQLGPDTAVAVGGGSSYTLRASGHVPLEVVAVSGRVAPEVACGAGPTSISLRDRARQPGASSRECQVLFEPACGCSGMTQFVGYLPAVRTPRHIHPYSEMLCIVRGKWHRRDRWSGVEGLCRLVLLPARRDAAPRPEPQRGLPGRAWRVHTSGWPRPEHTGRLMF